MSGELRKRFVGPLGVARCLEGVGGRKIGTGSSGRRTAVEAGFVSFVSLRGVVGMKLDSSPSSASGVAGMKPDSSASWSAPRRTRRRG